MRRPIWRSAGGPPWRCAIKATRPGKWLAAGLGLAALLAAGVGCNEDQAYVLYFTHFNHVKNYEIACAECHKKAPDGRFATLSHAMCNDCHKEWMDRKTVSEKTCGQCHKKRDLSELARKTTPESVNPPAASFVHTPALSNRCVQCHGDVMGPKLTQAPAMRRSDLVRMRAESHRGGEDCSTCHANMSRETAPADHAQNWVRRHGDRGSEPDRVCAVCHAEQTCRQCHEEMMPASHNNLWRQKTHGIASAWDRARCQVCHEPDSCTACHSEIRPQSHTANFRTTHCLECHPSSASGTGCTFCHEGGLDAHPNPHPAGFTANHCGQCHPGTPSGAQCAVCHPDSNLANHPNPHPLSYAKTHCGQCHLGQIQGISCKACHGGDLIASHPNPHPASYAKTHCTQCHDAQISGVSCKECHGADLLADHPDPHPASYVQTHCTSCHLGQIQGVACTTCHGADLTGNHPNPHAAGYRVSHCLTCHAGDQAADCETCHPGGSSVLIHQGTWPRNHDRYGERRNCLDCHPL